MTDSAYVDKLENDNQALSRQILELQDELAKYPKRETEAAQPSASGGPEQSPEAILYEKVTKSIYYKNYRVLNFKNTFNGEEDIFVQVKKFGFLWVYARRWPDFRDDCLIPRLFKRSFRNKKEAVDWIYGQVYEKIKNKSELQRVIWALENEV